MVGAFGLPLRRDTHWGVELEFILNGFRLAVNRVEPSNVRLLESRASRLRRIEGSRHFRAFFWQAL